MDHNDIVCWDKRLEWGFLGECKGIEEWDKFVLPVYYV